MKNRFENFDEYGLRHLPEHLIDSEGWDTLEEILTSLSFIDIKCREGMTYDLVGDYQATLAALPEAREENREERELDERLGSYTRDLIRYAKGEGDRIPDIPSVKPWKEGRIRENIERIKERPSRQDRLKDFSQFVNLQAYVLERFSERPGFCVQQAYNYFAEGSVGVAAEKEILSGAITECLILHLPDYREPYNPHPALIRTMEGHSDEIKAVALCADGRIAVSASRDRTLMVWKVDTGVRKHVLEGHSSFVDDVTISADGKVAVSGGYDKTLRAWNLETGRCLNMLEGITGKTGKVMLSPDGESAVFMENNKICIWNIKTGHCLQTSEVPSDDLFTRVMTIDGIALSGGVDQSMKAWRGEIVNYMEAMKGNGNLPLALAITPNGRIGISGDNGKTVRLWDINANRCSRTLEGHLKEVNTVAITPDGRIGVSGSQDKLIKAWDLETGECLRTMKGHSDYPESVAVSADGRIAISGGYDRTLRVWNIWKGFDLISRKRQSYFPGSAVYSADRRIVVSGRHEKVLRVWDVATNRLIRQIDGFSRQIEVLGLSADGRIAITGSWDKILRVWDIESGRCIRELEGGLKGFWAVALSGDGRIAVSAGKDNSLRIWDALSGKCMHSMEEDVLSAARSTQGPIEFLEGKNEDLHVLELETGRCIHSLERVIFTAALSMDGRTAVTGSEDGNVQAWDTESGMRLFDVNGHSERVQTAALSSDGRIAVTGGWDKTVVVWEVATGRRVGLTAHHSEWMSLFFKDDIIEGGDWSENVTLFKILNYNPTDSREIERIKRMRKVESLKTDLKKPKVREISVPPENVIPMRYKIQIYERNGVEEFHGQSQTLEAYTYENLGPFQSVEELLQQLDKGMQVASNAHNHVYIVNTFRRHPPELIEEPEERRFYPAGARSGE